MDQNLRVPRLHRLLQVAQDDAALLVRPVVQDVAHVVRSRPAHRLRREEVVHRGLDERRVLLRFRNLHHGRLLLQHEAACPCGDFGIELGEGVPAAAADVDKRCSAAAVEAGPLQQAFREWVEARVHEVGSVLTHADEVILERLQHARVLLDPDPVVGRLVRVLEGAVIGIFGVLVRGLEEILRHLAQRGADRIEASEQLELAGTAGSMVSEGWATLPVTDALAIFRELQILGDLILGIFILSSLLDHFHRGKVANQAANKLVGSLFWSSQLGY